MVNLTSYLLSICDYITGAFLTPKFPALMWGIYGLVLGGAVGFWLEAPVYGLRSKRPAIILAPLLVFALTSVGIQLARPAASLDMPPAPAPAPPPPPNFAGSWDTGKWGAITMVQDGNQVFGTYPYNNGVLEGAATPDMSGQSVLKYRWRNQQGGSSGVGYFRLSSDANSFEGKFTEGENLGDSGSDWSGKRTAAGAPPANFSGVWDTQWGEVTLRQGVTKVTGVYHYGGGLIDGVVRSKTLDFQWTNRVTGQSGRGQFVLATYGNSFSGTWVSGSEPLELGTSWSGTRR